MQPVCFVSSHAYIAIATVAICVAVLVHGHLDGYTCTANRMLLLLAIITLHYYICCTSYSTYMYSVKLYQVNDEN